MLKMENIDEFRNKVVTFEEQFDEKPSLSSLLEEVALVADIDSVDSSADRVMLMTLHSAKGLEFPSVYLAGMEDGLFPSYMCICSDDPTEIEEENCAAVHSLTVLHRLTLSLPDHRDFL